LVKVNSRAQYTPVVPRDLRHTSLNEYGGVRAGEARPGISLLRRGRLLRDYLIPIRQECIRKDRLIGVHTTTGVFMAHLSDWKEVLVTELKFLCFLPVRPDMKRLGHHYLFLAVGTAWLAGLGRYWDHPSAQWWQYAGLGSVAYIFVLALIVWLLFMPLGPKNWSYRNVLTFVGMTSPPAILYAIPVERFMDLAAAQSINVYFLAIVALWRVVMFVLYLVRSAQLKFSLVLFTAPLPMALIITTLAMLNLEQAVFNVMAGLHDANRTANDAAYGILFMLTVLSVYGSPILLTMYLVQIGRARPPKALEKETDASTRHPAESANTENSPVPADEE